MTSIRIVVWLAVFVTALSLAVAAWALLREQWIQWRTRVAVRRLEAALAAFDPVRVPASGDAEGAAPERDANIGAEGSPDLGALAARFDPLTLDRAIEAMLRSDASRTRAWGVRLATALGLVDRLAERVRSGAKWSERAHAAEVLGLAASPKAVPALVSALRDPHEDVGSVKLSAAEALARLEDPAAIALLVAELSVVDEHASPRVADAIVRFGSAAVTALVEVLATSTHTPARVWAARVLGRIGDPAATDPLVARLADRADTLRGAAAEALGLIGDRRALQSIIQATLRDPAPQVRAHAAAAASKIAGEDAVDVLVAALSDPDYGTRLRALEAFEHIEVRDTSGLERALHDVNPDVKRRAALALERVGFLAAVVEALAAPDDVVAERAYADLLKIGSAGLVDSIVGYLHHASFEVRARVADACGELAMIRTGPILVAALDDPEWPVRAALCRAVGRLRVPDGTPALTRLLADENEVVREAAIEALAEYDDAALTASMSSIAAAYAPGTAPIRWNVVGIVARAGGVEGLSLLVEASRDPSERVRARAVASLAGRDGAVTALVERLSDASLEVRMEAVSALGGAATEDAFEGLVRALPGAALAARERIAQALAKSAQGKLLDRLFALASSEDVDVRLGITWTLGKSGDVGAVPTLARLLVDREPKVRASAAGALGKIACSATDRALLSSLDDRDPRVRAAVVNAIAKTTKIGSPEAPVIRFTDDVPRGGSLPPRAENAHAALDALATRLSDPDGFVRNRAAIAVARVAGSTAAGVLAAAEEQGLLDDAPARVAWALVPGESAFGRVVALLEDPARLDRVRQFAQKEEPAVRDAFFRRLRLEVDGDGVDVGTDPALLVTRYEKVLAESQDVEGRLVAVEALDRIAHTRAVDLVADVLAGDPSETVRTRAAVALARRPQDRSARRALVRAIADPSQAVALVAIRSAGVARDRDAAAELHKRLGTGAAPVAEAVEIALTRIHEDDVMPFLDRMMGEDRAAPLAAAIRVLGRIASREAAPLLVELAQSRDPSVRAAAVRALGVLSDPDAVRSVDAALEDPSEDVRAAALDAIAAARSEPSLVRLEAVRRDPSATIRAELARVLRAFGGAVALRIVEGLASDGVKTVRASALVTLLERADEYSLVAFGRLWPEAAPDTRREVAAHPRRADAVAALAKVLATSTSPSLRAIAVAGVAALDPDDLSARLVVVLGDPAPAVRVAAVRGLARFDDPETVSRLEALATDPDEDVRAAIQRARMKLLG